MSFIILGDIKYLELPWTQLTPRVRKTTCKAGSSTGIHKHPGCSHPNLQNPGKYPVRRLVNTLTQSRLHGCFLVCPCRQMSKDSHSHIQAYLLKKHNSQAPPSCVHPYTYLAGGRPPIRQGHRKFQVPA